MVNESEIVVKRFVHIHRFGISDADACMCEEHELGDQSFVPDVSILDYYIYRQKVVEVVEGSGDNARVILYRGPILEEQKVCYSSTIFAAELQG